MNTNVARELETVSPPRRGGIEKIALFATKLLVTGACFWYVSLQIDLSQVLSAVSALDFRWAAFASLVAMLQVPLVATRWYGILGALSALDARMTRTAVVAASAVGAFFNQILPSVAGDGMRAWLVIRLGCDWRNAVMSVVIDRCVGVGLLITLGFVILLLPSGLTALGGYRNIVVILYGVALVAGVLALLLTPVFVPLLVRWRYSRWIGILAASAHRVLLGPNSLAILGLGCLVHILTIGIVWSLGLAQGLVLPIPDVAVLFAVTVGVALVPISIGGWGLREIAVVSLLGHYGIAPEKALLFSLCFGITLAIGSLPGVLAWLLYPFGPSQRSATRGS
jgi:glycosyltransferase 2 family protein